MADTLVLTAKLVGQVEQDLKKFGAALKTFEAQQTKNAPEAAAKFFKSISTAGEGTKKFGAAGRQLGKELQALGVTVGKLAPQFGALTEEAGLARVGLGSVVGIVAAIGSALVITSRQLAEFGRSVQNMRFAGAQAGFSITQMRDLEQVGQRFGITSEAVRKSAINFGWAATKVATNFESFRNELEQQGFGKLMQPMFNRLQHNANDTTGAFEDLLKVFDQIREQTPGAVGENRINWLAQKFGVEDWARQGYKSFQEANKHVVEMREAMGITAQDWDDTQKQAEQFRKDITDTQTIFENMGVLIAHEILPSFDKLATDFNSMFTKDNATGWAKRFADVLSTDRRDLQGIVSLFEWLEAHTPEWLKNILRRVMPGYGGGAGAGGGAGEGAGAGAGAGAGGGGAGTGAGAARIPGESARHFMTRKVMGPRTAGQMFPDEGGGALFRPGVGPRARGAAAGAAPGGTPGAAIGPGAETAVGGGPPAAFIMHHTGGGGTVAGVQETLRQRGLGVEYVMDREGNIVHTGGPGSANILPGWGAGKGLSNRNIVGMEVIAKSNRDVTQRQIAAAQQFIGANYPNTPVYGHGEVNPGHKEATEGMAIVNAIRAERDRHAITSSIQQKIEGSGKIDVTVGAGAAGKHHPRNILRTVPQQRLKQMDPAPSGSQGEIRT